MVAFSCTETTPLASRSSTCQKTANLQFSFGKFPPLKAFLQYPGWWKLPGIVPFRGMWRELLLFYRNFG